MVNGVGIVASVNVPDAGVDVSAAVMADVACGAVSFSGVAVSVYTVGAGTVSAVSFTMD